ncbi:MAG: hypothetical protein AB1489_42585 [Acidobacteriota bacterium]
MNIAKYSLKTADNTIVVQCAAHLKEQAEWLLNMLNSIQSKGKILTDGVKEQIGWSLLTLQKRGSELLVCEPDFWGDPFNNIRADITCTLTILAKQNKVLSILGIEGVPTSFQEKITLLPKCLQAQRTYLKREQPKFPSDSGWCIDVDEKTPLDDQYEVMAAYQLLDHRPELLQVLSLPLGYLVIFTGDSIETILNDKNEDVWNVTDQAVNS